MILADTAIWIDYFRGQNTQMRMLMSSAQIAMHPFVVAELALGSLHDRTNTLKFLDRMVGVRVASPGEVRQMIESRSLFSKGIGLTDTHLVASCLLTPGTQLWTRDSALQSVAKSLGVQAGFS